MGFQQAYRKLQIKIFSQSTKNIKNIIDKRIEKRYNLLIKQDEEIFICTPKLTL